MRYLQEKLSTEIKAKNIVDNTFHKSHTEYDRAVSDSEKFVDDFTGRMKQFNSTPGHTWSMDIAANESKKFLDEMGISIEELDKLVVFNRKFPHYSKFANYLLDSTKDPSQDASFYSKIDRILDLMKKSIHQCL